LVRELAVRGFQGQLPASPLSVVPRPFDQLTLDSLSIKALNAIIQFKWDISVIRILSLLADDGLRALAEQLLGLEELFDGQVERDFPQLHFLVAFQGNQLGNA